MKKIVSVFAVVLLMLLAVSCSQNVQNAADEKGGDFNLLKASSFMGFSRNISIDIPSTSGGHELSGCWVSDEMEDEIGKYKVGVKGDGEYVYFYIYCSPDLYEDPIWLKSPVGYDEEKDEPIYGGIKYRVGQKDSKNVMEITEDGEELGVYYSLENEGTELTITGEEDGEVCTIRFTKQEEGFFDGASEGSGGIVVAHGYLIASNFFDCLVWTDITADAIKTTDDLSGKVFFCNIGEMHFIFIFGEGSTLTTRELKEDSASPTGYYLHDFNETFSYKLGTNNTILIPKTIETSTGNSVIVDCGIYYTLQGNRMTLTGHDNYEPVVFTEQTIANFNNLDANATQGDWNGQKIPRAEDVQHFLQGEPVVLN